MPKENKEKVQINKRDAVGSYTPKERIQPIGATSQYLFNMRNFGQADAPVQLQVLSQGKKKINVEQQASNKKLAEQGKLQAYQKQQVEDAKNLEKAATVAPYVIPGLGQAMWAGKAVDVATSGISNGKYKSWGDMVDQNTGSGEFIGDLTNPGYYTGSVFNIGKKVIENPAKYSFINPIMDIVEGDWKYRNSLSTIRQPNQRTLENLKNRGVELVKGYKNKSALDEKIYLMKNPETGIYEFSADMGSSPLKAGIAFQRLEKKIPVGGVISETHNLSPMSFKLMAHMTRNPKFSNVIKGEIPVNYNHLGSMKTALNRLQHSEVLSTTKTDLNKIISKYKIPGNVRVEDYTERIPAPWGFENVNMRKFYIPKLEFTKLYKKGGILKAQEGIKITMPDGTEKTLNTSSQEYKNIYPNLTSKINENTYYKNLPEFTITSNRAGEHMARKGMNDAGKTMVKGVGAAGLAAVAAPALIGGLVSAPLATIGGFAGGMIGDYVTNKATQKLSGGKYQNWGEYAGAKTGIDSDIMAFTNPGAIVGGGVGSLGGKYTSSNIVPGIKNLGEVAKNLSSEAIDLIIPRKGYINTTTGNYSTNRFIQPKKTIPYVEYMKQQSTYRHQPTMTAGEHRAVFSRPYDSEVQQIIRANKNGIVKTIFNDAPKYEAKIAAVPGGRPSEYNMVMSSFDNPVIGGNVEDAVGGVIPKTSIKGFYQDLGNLLPRKAWFTGDAGSATVENRVWTNLQNKNFKTAFKTAWEYKPEAKFESAGLSVDSYPSLIKMGQRPGYDLKYVGDKGYFNPSGITNAKFLDGYDKVAALNKPELVQSYAEKVLTPWSKSFGGPIITGEIGTTKLNIPHPWVIKK